MVGAITFSPLVGSASNDEASTSSPFVKETKNKKQKNKKQKRKKKKEKREIEK